MLSPCEGLRHLSGIDVYCPERNPFEEPNEINTHGL